jgi:hypothetical protein
MPKTNARLLKGPRPSKHQQLSKEEIVAALREAAEKLGHVPAMQEFQHVSGIGQANLRRQFRNYAEVLRGAGLERQGRSRYRVSMKELFVSWAALARKLGRIPTSRDYGEHSKYSTTPLAARFGNWGSVAMGLVGYAEQNGLEKEWRDVLEMVRLKLKEPRRRRAGSYVAEKDSQPHARPVLRADRPVFGPALTPMAMAHAPTNEQGVICLFGMLAAELGFIVLRIQTEFPDCKAMRRVDEKRWQEVWIEFEFESRNYLAHMHKLDGCDLIVCWEDNWPDCPLEVVELKQALRRRQIAAIFPE